jgi:GNAT superfamily N-acetyltransferase
MDFVIRKAAETDIEALVRCHKSFMEHHINIDKRFALRTGAEEKWEEQITNSLKDPNTLVLVAESDSYIAGCAYTIIKEGAMDFGPRKIGYLCDVFVEPDYRRQGITRQFLLTTQKWLQERGINTIEASWAVYCVEAQKTWRALGFIPLSISGQMDF